MKVLHVFPGRDYGGIQSMLVTLARDRAVCPDLQPSFALNYTGRLSEELLAAGVPVHLLGPAKSRFPWQVFRARRRLAALLRTGGFDLVVCHASWALAVYGGIVRRAGLPLVFWMHNNSLAARKNFVETRAGLQIPDLAICNSNFTASTLSLLFFRRIPRHVVVACPVSRPLGLDGLPERRRTLRAELNTDENAVVIMLASRPERWKGHTLLFDALGAMRDDPRWKCWIVGGAVDPEQHAFLAGLGAQAARLGIADRVVFAGARRDVPALMRSADIFCHPNLAPEPFGIAFIEALYAGLPVVSIDHGGAAEIVDPTCGRLVPPDDVDALARALGEQVDNPDLRRRLGAAAVQHGASVSGPEVVLPKLRDVFHSVLADCGNQLSRSTVQQRPNLDESST